MDTTGIFSLSDVFNNVSSNRWTAYNKDTCMSEYYGWFGPCGSSNIRVIDFANATHWSEPRGGLIGGSCTNGTAESRTCGYNITVGSGGSQKFSFFNLTGQAGSVGFAYAGSAPSLGSSLPVITESSMCSSVSSVPYAWTSYGLVGNTHTGIWRMDFSSDLTAMSCRACRVNNIGYAVTVSDYCNYGWWVAGQYGPSPTPAAPRSSIYRLTYASDLGALPARGPSALAGRKCGAFDNQCSYGWFTGNAGTPGVTTGNTRIERIDYANDLATASIRAAGLAPSKMAVTPWLKSSTFAISVTNSMSYRYVYANDLTATTEADAFHATLYRQSIPGGGYPETTCPGWGI